ncbi:hypothetical protein Barb7_02179 [Bacteroidales bacterium Barb7]|nr:hypothetical protein Barb7_02179 [Bacteroidales bacterium Barb7]
MPALRNANSRRRFASMSYRYSVTMKMELSGLNVMVVPVAVLTSPVSFISFNALPQEYSCIYTFPSLRISAFR